jgi:hypothetical protein
VESLTSPFSEEHQALSMQASNQHNSWHLTLTWKFIRYFRYPPEDINDPPLTVQLIFG